MDFLTFLVNTTTQAPAGTKEAVVDTATGAATAGTPTGTIVSLGLYAVFFVGVMFFMVIRPQKKREKKMKEMMTNIRTGDSVMTNSGMYGKIVDVTEDCFIIEFGTNRGIRIPVQKSEVAGVREPNLSSKKYDEITTTEETK